jgi:DNA-binding NarL/FixJ family response regulator
VDSTLDISLTAGGEVRREEAPSPAFAKGPEKVRILLVDDQPEIRRGLRMRLELEPDLVVAGEAGDGREVREAVLALRPHVVVMDVAMPGVGGIEAALTALSTAAVVMLSLYDDARTRESALAAGAVGFVAKHEPQQALVREIRRAVRATTDESGRREM